MSQGTADLISESCREFWDGYNLCPLGERERYGRDLIYFGSCDGLRFKS